MLDEIINSLRENKLYLQPWSFDFLNQTEDSPTASGDATQDSEQSAEALKESIRLIEVCLVDVEVTLCCDCVNIVVTMTSDITLMSVVTVTILINNSLLKGYYLKQKVVRFFFGSFIILFIFCCILVLVEKCSFC